MEAYNSCCHGAGNCGPGDCETTRPLREENTLLRAKLAKVVEAADDAYKYLYSPGFGPDTPKLPLVKVMANLEAALAVVKGEK